MSEYKIEKNVPLPTANNMRSRYPLRELQVGDSFVVPIADRASVAGVAKTIGDRYERRFTTRKINEAFVRIWRVE